VYLDRVGYVDLLLDGWLVVYSPADMVAQVLGVLARRR